MRLKVSRSDPLGGYARVAVPRPVRRTFHYRIPERLSPWVRPGVRCVVPFGRTRLPGFVVAVEETAEVPRVRELLEVLDREPCLTPDLVGLGMWLASYYHHPPGETFAAMLPPTFRAGAEPVYRAGPRPEAPDGSGEERLWRRVREKGELAAASVRPSEFLLLGRLLAQGCLVREWRVELPPAPKGLEWFRLSPKAPAPTEVVRRAPRQAQALAALGEGPLPGRVLRDRGVARDALTKAVARGWVERWEEAPRAEDPGGLGISAPSALLDLTPEQGEAVDAAARGLDGGGFVPLLLQGVTGSGKTEVYLRSVGEALARGRGALVLFPEIALTPQMLGRFLSRFGDRVAILHSGLGDRERRLQWERVWRGDAPVVLGARSAVFAPVARLGLVVVDEEHEPSYKQEDGLRYHAKHAALVRARTSGAVALLGSATPDVETYWASSEGRYGRAVLPRRVMDAHPPRVRVVDLRQEEGRRRERVLLSEPLRGAVGAALGRGEQCLLFLNRRGYSPALTCPSCGEAVSCRSCSIALTLHRSSGGGEGLLCHYCGRRQPPPGKCPACGNEGLSPAGAGTQRLMASVAEAWPGARAVRLDRDAVRRDGGAEILGGFHRGDADILVGTQMVAKGHHFPRLTVVGVVDADLSLHFPDFRAAERTFQVLTQVAGRAGREELLGEVFLQTRNPHHPVIDAVVTADYEGFAEAELDARREAGFPPFRRLALLRVSAPVEEQAREAARAAAEECRRLGEAWGVEVLGPAPAPIERLRGRWRLQVLLRAPGPEPAPVQAVLRRLWGSAAGAPSGDVRLHVDVDPVSML